MGPGLKNWDVGVFRASYDDVGSGLTIWAAVAVVAGLAATVAAIITGRKKEDGA